MGIIALFSLVILWLAVATAVSRDEAKQVVTEMVELPAGAAP
jgi:hypothetical protein